MKKTIWQPIALGVAFGLLAGIALFYFNNIPVELALIIVITSLILLGLPARYRKPLWYELKKAPDRNGKIQDE